MLDGIMPIPILLAFAIALPVVRSEHALILETVYLNGIGPLRMVVDTGAQSTAVTPAVAARIGVKPRFRVEHLTVSGAHLVTGGYVHMQTGAFEADSVETIICELDGARRLTNIDGVIGQSWLARFNYLIDLRADALVLDAQPPPGRRQPFSLIDGRPAISIAIDGRLRTVVLDSGTAGLVLFAKPTMGESVLVRRTMALLKPLATSCSQTFLRSDASG